MTDPSHPDPRPPAADGEREEGSTFDEALAYLRPHKLVSSDAPVVLKAGMLRCCVSAILMREADILSRLTAAEAGREEAEKELTALRRVHRWNVEHSDGEVLVCRNNHDKGEDCDWERFVPEERLTTAEAERDEALRISAEALALVPKHAVEAAKAEIHRDVAVAERDAALARVEKLEKALGEAANWHDSAADDLAGLPQNSHTHWWRTVHGQRSDEIRSALTEAGRHALKDA